MAGKPIYMCGDTHNERVLQRPLFAQQRLPGVRARLGQQAEPDARCPAR